MKELKNKEVIIGLIVLILLCVIALCLIARREFPTKNNIKDNALASVEEIPIAENQGNSVAGLNEGLTEEKGAVGAGQNISGAALDKEAAMTDEVLTKKESSLGISTKISGEYHSEPVMTEYAGDDLWQLEELYTYWDEYKLDAVDDLIHLPRVRTITNELSGTNYFYYYGSKNADGLPNGKGLAVYADNAYYCGEWKNGKRSGKGMWLQIYPDKTATLNGVTGVTEHSYNGSWQNDYPNGEGQEHISYDFEKMKGEYIITNVIGGFKDGYYDGELYIMTIEGENNTTEWEAVAKKGVYSYCDERINTSGKRTVWDKMRHLENQDNHRWMNEKENTNFGIYGLKKKN